MKKKSAIKFAQRLADFLSLAPEAELIGGDEIKLAKILIPRTTDLQAAEAFAGYVKAERSAVGETAEDYGFIVTNEESGDDVKLVYHSMQKIKNEVYFFFEIQECKDTDEDEDEVSADANKDKEEKEEILEQD